MCHFGQNINTNNSSVDVKTMYILKQELWDNFIFGQVNYQQFENHVLELVNAIIEKNNLKSTETLPELNFGNNNVSK